MKVTAARIVGESMEMRGERTRKKEKNEGEVRVKGGEKETEDEV